MTRLQHLDLNEPVFRSPYRVIYGDTDAGGMVYYAHYLRFIEQGRNDWMRAAGLPYSDIEAQGLIMPVVECTLRYKAPARYDDLLVIETALAAVDKQICRFHYRVLRVGEARPLVIGATVHAAIDRTGRLARLPAAAVTTLQAILHSGCLPPQMA